jgi:hypothetical protein
MGFMPDPVGVVQEQSKATNGIQKTIRRDGIMKKSGRGAAP